MPCWPDLYCVAVVVRCVCRAFDLGSRHQVAMAANRPALHWRNGGLLRSAGTVFPIVLILGEP